MGIIDPNTTIYDNYKQTSHNMFYEKDDRKYPKRARKAFPILIERAKNKGKPIGYAELADRLCIEPYARREQHIGTHVLACISTTLHQLEQKTGEKLPRLTNIVFSHDSLSNNNNYIVKRYKELYGSMLTWENYEDKLLAPIHAYEKWDEVLNTIERAKA